MTDAERQWVSAAKDGDVEAFNQLVRMYEGRVYGLAYRMLGDSDSAADVAQDTFISAFKAIKRFREGSFAAWLLRIATNACYDVLRAQKRRRTTSMDQLLAGDDDSPGEQFEDQSLPLDQHMINRELQAAIQAGLATLPEDQRAVLIMCDIQGFAYEEIAAATDTQLGTVKSRLSRARAKLRNYLKSRELLPTAER